MESLTGFCLSTQVVLRGECKVLRYLESFQRFTELITIDEHEIHHYTMASFQSGLGLFSMKCCIKWVHLISMMFTIYHLKVIGMVLVIGILWLVVIGMEMAGFYLPRYIDLIGDRTIALDPTMG